jgi:AcrR family transcriptional regulator
MSPRPYQLGKRSAAKEQTRAKIVTAGRDLLAGDAGPVEFSMEAIARRADVSRLTIYYQFESKQGLLDALYDHLAARGGMQHMREVFREYDPLVALATFVRIFIGFWSSDRIVIRRLRGMAAVDPDIEKGIRTRDEWRRNIARKIVERMVERYNLPHLQEQARAADILHMLTSFETFDVLMVPERTSQEATAIILRMARAAVGMPEAR